MIHENKTSTLGACGDNYFVPVRKMVDEDETSMLGACGCNYFLPVYVSRLTSWYQSGVRSELPPPQLQRTKRKHNEQRSNNEVAIFQVRREEKRA